MKRRLILLLSTIIITGGLLITCQNSMKATPLQPTSKKVDLKRFMGDWYVIAHIPTFIETKAYNAVERYELAADGTIPTTFTFNKGASDGPLKTYNPKGFVHNAETNAEWRMQFVWPFKAAFLITYLDDDYQTSVVGVPDRKYAWIMARTKTIPAAELEKLEKFLADSGHDMSKLRRVPQQ